LERALTAAEREPRPLAVEVEAGREVDRQRQPRRQSTVLRREPHRARLAVHRQLDTGERTDLSRPDARAADDRVRRDATARRLDSDDAALAHVDARERA